MEEEKLELWNNGAERNRYIDDSIRNLEILKTLYFYTTDDDILKAKELLKRIAFTVSALNTEVLFQEKNINVKVKKNI